MATFKEKIQDFIIRHHLMSDDGKYLVALSGGADSMALLTVIQSLGYDVDAVHCNFHLRGEESDRDEQFCVEHCKSLHVRLHLAHFDTLFYAKTHKISIEMAARELRYSYFEQLRRDLSADGILVAHHKDDSVETILMNLIRGTGIHGLTGISPCHDFILRPLLCVDRHEIEEYLEKQKIGYVTDSSNFSDDVVRNKIRLNVLPLLRTINPSVSSSIYNTSTRLRQVAEVFDEAMRQKVEEAVVSSNERETRYDIDKISNEYTLFNILRPCSFSPEQISEIYLSLHTTEVSGRVFSSSSHEMLTDRGNIVVQPKENPFRPQSIPETGNYLLPNGRRLSVKRQVIDTDFSISKQPEKVCLSAEKVSFPLTLRIAAAGDRFRPLGMKGMKLVSDFLTDLKISLFDKRRQLVIEDATGKIVWVVALRPDERCRITEQSKEALILEYI